MKWRAAKAKLAGRVVSERANPGVRDSTTIHMICNVILIELKKYQENQVVVHGRHLFDMYGQPCTFRPPEGGTPNENDVAMHFAVLNLKF